MSFMSSFMRYFMLINQLEVKMCNFEENLRKNNQSSYLYLTRNKNEAAVWQWHFLPQRGMINKIEVALSKKLLKISREQWIYKAEYQKFNARNIDTFPVISFFENNTFLMTEKFNT